MLAIIGLGNPGPRYTKTRHNAGFMVIQELAARHNIALSQREQYMAYRGSIGDETIVLMEPLTFMNLSGRAVALGMRKFGYEPEDIIVVCDDMDIETGRIKIKPGGSSGGHNGIQSIMDSTGDKDFPRIKVGIGRDPRIPSEKYVLSKFRPDEQDALLESIQTAADALDDIIKNGLQHAMNTFNRKPDTDQ